KVVPIRYGRSPQHAAIGEALYLDNDGSPGYDVQIEPIQVDEWVISFEPVERVAGEAVSEATIMYDNDQIARLSALWSSPERRPAAFPLVIRYRDFDSQWYRSVASWNVTY